MIRGAEICPRITITKITISEKEMHLQKEQECGEMSRKTKKCGYRKRILAGVLSAVVALSSVQMPVTAVHAAAWDQNKFSDSLKLAQELPEVLAHGMGNYMYLARFESKEQMDTFCQYALEIKEPEVLPEIPVKSSGFT